MERNCGKCVLRTRDKICPIFQEQMQDEELGCPRFTGEIKPCGLCGQPVVGLGQIVCTKRPINDEDEWEYKTLCARCAENFGKCQTCAMARSCAFETDPSPTPKYIQKVIRQGNMTMQTQVKNENRIDVTCKQSCPCWSKAQDMCWREICTDGCEDWRPK